MALRRRRNRASLSRAAAIYLHLQQLIPEDRTAETLADLFGVPSLCPASVMDWVRRKASALAPVVGRIGALVAAAPVRGLDETGFRVAGQTQWRHTIATESLTLHRVSAKRGDGPNTLAGGVVVHDGFKSYGALESASHALCNAHHLRELKALIEFDHEPWAAPMRDLLLDANRAAGEAKAQGDRALDGALLERFDTRISGDLARRARVPPQAAQPSPGRHGQAQAKAGREPVAPAAQVQGRRPALPGRLRRPFHQQPC
jgi:transposase